MLVHHYFDKKKHSPVPPAKLCGYNLNSITRALLRRLLACDNVFITAIRDFIFTACHPYTNDFSFFLFRLFVSPVNATAAVKERKDIGNTNTVFSEV